MYEEVKGHDGCNQFSNDSEKQIKISRERESMIKQFLAAKC